jgi:hypothetical protein
VVVGSLTAVGLHMLRGDRADLVFTYFFLAPVALVGQLLASKGIDFTALAGEHGLDHPDVGPAAHKITHGNALDIGLLLLVVWAMVAKPTM